MMNKKFCLIPISIFLVFSLMSCGENEHGPDDVTGISSGTYYHFLPGSDGILESAERVELKGKIDRSALIEQLGAHLAGTYFAKVNSDQTSIRFAQVDLQSIHTNQRTYFIAIINMIDENQSGLKYFFQGSSGGQVTFAMIAATFLQPQNNPPLLDGLILQYNGETFPELVHISFEGIVTLRDIKGAAVAAINNSKSESE